MQELNFKTLFSDPAHFIALGFGAGLVPKIPGTIGTLLAIPIYLLLTELSLLWYLSVVMGITIIGIFVAGRSERLLEKQDPRAIVIDEIAGMLLGFTALPSGWVWILIAFIIFRYLDMVKPWPICLFDRHIHGGLGIMLDDIVAGALTIAGVHLLAMSGFIANFT